MSPILSQIMTLEKPEEIERYDFVSTITLLLNYEMTTRISLLYGITLYNTSALRWRSFMITNLITTGNVLQQRYQAL